MSGKQASAPKAPTQKRLMNIALYYLGRYETSSSRLSAFLSRRVAKDRLKGAQVPENIDEIIAAVVQKVCEDGYVDDKRFAYSVARRMKSAGKSNRAVFEKLRQAGISDDIKRQVADSFEEDGGDSDLEAARRLVQKRKLGAFRPEEQRKEFAKKDLAVLARAGFSFETAVKALDIRDAEDEYEY